MPVSINCTACCRDFSVADACRDRVLVCPQCGAKMLNVKALAVLPVPEPGTGWLFGLGGLGLLILGVLVVVIGDELERDPLQRTLWLIEMLGLPVAALLGLRLLRRENALVYSLMLMVVGGMAIIGVVGLAILLLCAVACVANLMR